MNFQTFARTGRIILCAAILLGVCTHAFSQSAAPQAIPGDGSRGGCLDRGGLLGKACPADWTTAAMRAARAEFNTKVESH